MKKYGFWLILLVMIGLTVVGFHNQLTLTEYTVANARIPDSFDGYRIAVVSDLHAERFGERQQDLIAMLRGAECDLICLAGDMVSYNTTDFSPVWELLDGLEGIPTVYVAGNNELSLTNYDLFLSEMSSRGVTILDDVGQSSMSLDNGTDAILIHGYPFSDMRHLGGRIPVAQSGQFNILLYHDPYCFPEAALLDYDLMISGHVHGGVIRFPLIGSPLEVMGIEPYTKGVYTSKAASLVVSGGLGNHGNLPRFCNDPEVAVITLDSSGSSYRK